jgi:hypothetical protein
MSKKAFCNCCVVYKLWPAHLLEPTALPAAALRTLQGHGEGVLSVQDVMVTWVVTDVEGSTQLWEWDAGVMDDCVERHNTVGAQVPVVCAVSCSSSA